MNSDPIFIFTVGIMVFATYYIPPVSGIPPAKMYTAHNNIFGWADPGMDKGSVKYLGKYTSTLDCAIACVAYEGGKCMSYTYHTEAFGGAYSTMCYGRINDPLWSPHREENINSGRIEWPCESDMDCSLNGRCAFDGRCDCDLAWRGHRCDSLNLLPADRNTGYHATEDGRNVSSWGGAVVRDDKTGIYHMYIAEMSNHCGINSWTRNSRIVHATSTDPLGNYQREDVVWPPFAHEPDVTKGPNGELVMMWSSYKAAGPLCNCTDGSTDPSCQTPGAKIRTLVSETRGPTGPWSTPVSVLTAQSQVSDLNLAAVILKNGTLVGFSRYWWGNGSRIHLTIAGDWRSPATYTMYPEEVWPDMPAFGTEDPFMYLDKNGHYHAVFHNKYPNDFDTVGGHAYSKDGINWVYGGVAYNSDVHFTDGGFFRFSRRERPHLIFAEDGVTPIALTNGVQYGGKFGDATYTFLQPIRASL